MPRLWLNSDCWRFLNSSRILVLRCKLSSSTNFINVYKQGIVRTNSIPLSRLNDLLRDKSRSRWWFRFENALSNNIFIWSYAINNGYSSYELWATSCFWFKTKICSPWWFSSITRNLRFKNKRISSWKLKRKSSNYYNYSHKKL